MNIIKVLDYQFDIDQLVHAEIQILKALNFGLFFVTPLELANMMLFLADPTFDYSSIQPKLVSMINFCMIDLDISVKQNLTSFAISYGSILVTLERLGWTEFKAEFIKFMSIQSGE